MKEYSTVTQRKYQLQVSCQQPPPHFPELESILLPDGPASMWAKIVCVTVKNLVSITHAVIDRICHWTLTAGQGWQTTWR